MLLGLCAQTAMPANARQRAREARMKTTAPALQAQARSGGASRVSLPAFSVGPSRGAASDRFISADRFFQVLPQSALTIAPAADSASGLAAPGGAVVSADAPEGSSSHSQAQTFEAPADPSALNFQRRMLLMTRLLRRPLASVSEINLHEEAVVAAGRDIQNILTSQVAAGKGRASPAEFQHGMGFLEGLGNPPIMLGRPAVEKNISSKVVPGRPEPQATDAGQRAESGLVAPVISLIAMNVLENGLGIILYPASPDFYASMTRAILLNRPSRSIAAPAYVAQPDVYRAVSAAPIASAAPAAAADSLIFSADQSEFHAFLESFDRQPRPLSFYSHGRYNYGSRKPENRFLAPLSPAGSPVRAGVGAGLSLLFLALAILAVRQQPD